MLAPSCVLDDTGTVRLYKRLPCDRARFYHEHLDGLAEAS